MSKETVRNALQADFSTVWGGAYPTQTVFWDNMTPDDDSDLPAGPHVVHSIQFNESRQIGLGVGARYWRYWGQIAVVLKAEIGGGPLLTTRMLDTIDANLKSKVVGTATLDTPTVSFSQRLGRWYTTLVTIPFHFDENES